MPILQACVSRIVTMKFVNSRFVHLLLQSLLLFTWGLGVASSDDLFKTRAVQAEYDFIIVGGGTAGLVLADRLSECANQTILVLEAGPRPEVVRTYKYPASLQITGSLIDWNFGTTPQPNLGGRVLPYHRGRALGGSSAINGLYYGRGSASVYDTWASLGNPGWSWSDVYPYFQKGTSFNPPDAADGYDNRYKTWDPAAYSKGPLQIGFQGFVRESSAAFIQALSAANVPIVDELNAGNNTGVRQGTATIDHNYRRSSSYDSYYKDAAGRPNLQVLYDAQVQTVTTAQQGDALAATGIVFIDQATSLFQRVTARKEVILSAGAFQSPQLLMVSGIGPARVLAAAGVTPALVNENVGQHMADHHVFSVVAQVQPQASYDSIFNDLPAVQAAQAAFFANTSGPFTGGPGITNGFQRLTAAQLTETGADAVVAAGLANQSHVEFSYEAAWYPPVPTKYFAPAKNGNYISLTASSMAPLSRGNVSITSGMITDPPVISPNYLTESADRALALHAFRDLRRVLAHPALAALTVGPAGGEVGPGAAVQSDADILDYIKATTIPNWHAAGTNQMRPRQDGGVVDARLRVHGVKGLRVVDCSVIPLLPDVNIQGTVYMGCRGGRPSKPVLGRQLCDLVVFFLL